MLKLAYKSNQRKCSLLKYQKQHSKLKVRHNRRLRNMLCSCLHKSY